MKYFVQHNAGLGELVISCLAADLKRIRVDLTDDSAIILDATATPQDLAGLPYLKNSFVILAETKRVAMGMAIKNLAKHLGRSQIMPLAPRRRGFRIMISIDGELVSIPRDARSHLETTIASITGGHVQARGSGEEYWIVGRRDFGTLLLGLRIARKKQPAAPKGSLDPGLSHMLVRATKPSPRDTFLDPFAGSGVIPAARLAFAARQVIYSDVNYDSLRKPLVSGLANAKRVRFLADDALVLPSIADGSVDVVVTDPPWGEYEAMNMSFEQFAAEFAASLDRVLRPESGRFVILIARRAAGVFVDKLSLMRLEISAEYEILVNGHPATVLIGGRQQVTVSARLT